MKIAFFTHYTELYGANRSLITLMEGLRTHGCTPLLISPKAGAVTEYCQKANIASLILPFNWWFHQSDENDKTQSGINRLNENLNHLPRLSGFLANWKTDLIYSNSSVINIGLLAAKKLQIPHLWHMREFGDLDYNLNPDTNRILFKQLLCCSDGLIFISKALKKYLFDNCTHPNEKIIYNGVVLSKEMDHRLKLRNNKAPGRDPIISLAGFIHPNKGQNTAIEAMALVKKHFPTAKLIIAGGGNPEKLQRRVEELQLKNNILFTGQSSNILDLFTASDISLMCSRNEAMGRVTAEAMACGCPVIGFAGGATPEIITHNENGLLYRGGAENLAEKIVKLLNNPNLCKTLGEAAWIAAKKRFTIENYIASIIKIIKNTTCQMNGSAIPTVLFENKTDSPGISTNSYYTETYNRHLPINQVKMDFGSDFQDKNSLFDPEKDTMLCFVHIPKTAGTTLVSIINNQYEQQKIIRLHSKKAKAEFETFSSEYKNSCSAVMGYIPYGIHKEFRTKYAYITLLRDPVKRAVSHYNYVISRPSHYLYKRVKGLSLLEYCSLGLGELDNRQLRYVAGFTDIPRGKCTSEMLEIAKNCLKNNYITFGLTERFDESILLFRKTFKWHTPFYHKKNITKNSPHPSPLTPDIVSLIKEQNLFEIELYNYAKELFDKRISNLGEDFQEDLRAFHIINSYFTALTGSERNSLASASDTSNALMSNIEKLYRTNDLRTAEKAISMLMEISSRISTQPDLKSAAKQHSRHLNTVGEFCFKFSHIESSANIFFSALQLDPENSTSYSNLGVTYWSKKEYRKSHKHLRNAIDINGDDKAALLNYIETSRLLGLTQDALSACNTYLENHPYDQEIRNIQEKILSDSQAKTA